MTTFLCPRHPGERVSAGEGSEGCPRCVAFLADAPDPATMTGEERADELRSWIGDVLPVAFPLVHERAEQLVGRPVWTHEFASSVVEKLFDEARDRNHPENLRAHVTEGLADLIGAEKVYVYPPTPQPDEDNP